MCYNGFLFLIKGKNAPVGTGTFDLFYNLQKIDINVDSQIKK